MIKRTSQRFTSDNLALPSEVTEEIAARDAYRARNEAWWSRGGTSKA